MSYTLRGVVAILLMIGFYALALGVAGLLLLLVYLNITSGTRIYARLVIGGLIGAVTILWSVLPRPDRFQAPGPRLQESDHPELFRELKVLAGSTGQKMPEEVYLIMDVNAWVSQRGGWFGIGSRRVMGLGLPLLLGLGQNEMKAVIAHEFGHYYGGDTTLGPVLYRTRSAIGRTIGGLGNSWIQLPFRWYGTMFLRITQAISRRQEYSADALSARVVGPSFLSNGLKKIPGLVEGFQVYFQSEVLPVLNSGFLPPIANGFSLFLAHPEISSKVKQIQEAALGESAGNPYDTHPPLPKRIAALGDMDEKRGEAQESGQAAVSWICEPSRMERLLLIHIFGPEGVKILEPLEWNQVGPRVFLPLYEKQLKSQKPAISGITPSMYPELSRSWAKVADNLVVESRDPVPREQLDAYAKHLLGAALTLALHRKGWKIEAGPGHPVTMIHDGVEIKPFLILEELKNGRVSGEKWMELARKGGFGETDYSTLI